MGETKFQAELVKKLRKMFPGCEIHKNDAAHIQGIPDLTIFYRDTWAMLEVKKSEKASMRPNQDYYVERYNNMSFAAFIFPENEEEVLHELQQAFASKRKTRISKSK